MNIPNLPTDNLYKFIALTGVFLFIVSIFYPEYKRTEIRDEISIFNGEIKKMTIENDKSKRKLKEIKEEIETLDQKSNNQAKSIVNDSLIVRARFIDGPPELVEMSRRIDNLVNEYLELNRQIEFKSIDISTKSQLIDDKQKDLDVLQEVSGVFFPCSILIAFFGFSMWYQQTQKFQDKILKEQSSQYFKIYICQSCGMKLSNQTHYHLFTEDEKKSIYCKDCFDVSDFSEPNLTLQEMKQKVRKRCKKLGFGRIATYFLVSRISDLDRWREKFKW